MTRKSLDKMGAMCRPHGRYNYCVQGFGSGRNKSLFWLGLRMEDDTKL